jgi:octopine/nopaline transport system substrate-binding protein
MHRRSGVWERSGKKKGDRAMRFVVTLFWAIVAVTLAVVAPAQAQTKDWKKIRIGTEGAYAPWNFSEAGGKLSGFEIDLANELCKRMNAECTIVAQDWDGIIPALQASKYDAIMAAMNITDKRLETINFSNVYAAAPASFAVLKSSPLAKLPGTGENYPLASKAAEAQKAIDAMKPMLKGKVIGAQVSTTNLNFVEKYFKDQVDIRSYKTTEQHDLDLTAGRIDGAFAAVTYWNDVMSKPDGKDVTLAGPQFSGDVLGRGVAAGLRKEDTELKAKFDEAIKQVSADGTCTKLSEKWFKGLDICPK